MPGLDIFYYELFMRDTLALDFSAQQDRDPCTIHKNKISQAFLNERNEENFSVTLLLHTSL